MRYWTERADQAEERRRTELRDRTSDTIGWGVAILAGLLSLEGFELFGQAMGWPALKLLGLGTYLTVPPMVLLWVTVDLLALIAMRQWLNPGYSTATQQLGMVVSTAALIVSVLINVVGHWLASGPYWWAALPASALPPALLWCTLFMRDRRNRDQDYRASQARTEYDQRAQRAADRAEKTSRDIPARDRTTSTADTRTSNRQSVGQSGPSRPDRRAVPRQQPDQTTVGPRTDLTRRTDEDLLQQLLALDREVGRTVGKATAARRLRIGTERYNRLRAMADGQTNTGPAVIQPDRPSVSGPDHAPSSEAN